jgi:hypothetical protein
MERNYYEDYHIEDVFKSPGRTVTETDIVLFSALTGTGMRYIPMWSLPVKLYSGKELRTGS